MSILYKLLKRHSASCHVPPRALQLVTPRRWDLGVGVAAKTRPNWYSEVPCVRGVPLHIQIPSQSGELSDRPAPQYHPASGTVRAVERSLNGSSAKQGFPPRVQQDYGGEVQAGA
jgi:hypothetical protein